MKRKNKPAPSTYPPSPHIVGLNWLELPVRRPLASAKIYHQIGFRLRPMIDATPVLGIGGVAVHFRRVRPLSPPGTRSGLLIELAVDNVDLQHQHMLGLGLNLGPLFQQQRGDRAFEWLDADGHVLRFIGPARRPDDPTAK